MSNVQVIPDNKDAKDVKLNFKNLFAFLSSLDYLAFLEKEGAFRHMGSTEYLYYTEEKTQLWIFTMKEYLKWVSFTYLITGLTFSIVLKLNFIASTLISAFIYGVFSIWMVNRYLWGRGYLYNVLRDFLLASFLLSLVMWLGLELFLFITVPYAWNAFEKWLFTPDKSTLTQLIYTPALFFYLTIKQYISTAEIFKSLLKSFFLTLPVKVFTFLVPLVYFYYLRNKRQTTRDFWMSLIEKVK